MSYDRNNRVQRTTTTTRSNARRNGRYLPPPPPPPSGSSRNHSVLGYWVPLITIGTIAVGGLAAWVWSERGHDDEEHYPQDKPSRPPPPSQGPYSGPPNPQGPPGSFSSGPSGPPPPAPPGGEAASYYNASRSNETSSQEVRTDQTFLSRVSGVIGRTPSPQQFFGHASRQVSAGVAAAGAAAGAALGRIMEEDKHDDSYHFESEQSNRFERRDGREEREGFSDHERWSEEAEEKRRSEMSSSARRDDKGKAKTKKVVAIVLSAELAEEYSHDEDTFTEHGSILSHLPGHFDSSSTTLFVLIYTPTLTSLPPLNYQPQNSANRAPSSLGGSYSHISTPAATPKSELASISPRIMPTDISSSSSSHFDALYAQALNLVENSSYIMPFTTVDGYVAMLRHLAPQIVYVSDTLSGDEGRYVSGLKGWVGHTVVVAGDDRHGGLADTETETEDERVRRDNKDSSRRSAYRWYEHSNMVGLGKDVEVVDAARVGDDWSKRVGGRE